MKNKKRVILLCFFFSPLFSSALQAEIIQLKNGNAIETKILNEDGDLITVEAPGGKVKIPKRDIRTIWRGTKEEMMEVRGRVVYFTKGVELYNEGKFKAAAETFKQAIVPGAANAAIYTNLGSAYASLGEQQRAEENFLKAIQEDPDDQKTLLNLAKHYQSVKKFPKAATFFNKYLIRNPNDEAAKLDLANCYFAAGDYRNALETYSSLAQENMIPVLNNKAATLISLGQLDEAEAILNPLTAKGTRFVKPYLNMAEIYRRQGKNDLAQHQYKIVLSKDPQNSEAKIASGRLFLETDDEQKAEKIFKKALAVDPDNITLMYEYAGIFLRRGEFPEAEKQYEKILEVDPANRTALNGLGLLYLKMNKPQEALEAFKKILALDERDAKGHANAGLAYAFLNDADNALSEWNRALELDPGLEAALKNKEVLEEILQGEKVDKAV